MCRCLMSKKAPMGTKTGANTVQSEEDGSSGSWSGGGEGGVCAKRSGANSSQSDGALAQGGDHGTKQTWTTQATVDGISDVSLPVMRQRRGWCQFSPTDLEIRCNQRLGCTCSGSHPKRCARAGVSSSGLEGMLAEDEKSALLGKCTRGLLLSRYALVWICGGDNARKSFSQGSISRGQVKRAERLVRAGACSEASGGLKVGVKSMDPSRHFCPVSEVGRWRSQWSWRRWDFHEGAAVRDGNATSALNGITFATMSIAWPSGARHEHAELSLFGQNTLLIGTSVTWRQFWKRLWRVSCKVGELAVALAADIPDEIVSFVLVTAGVGWLASAC